MNEHIAEIVEEIHEFLYDRYAEDVKRSCTNDEMKKIKTLYREVFTALKHNREEYYRQMELVVPEF